VAPKPVAASPTSPLIVGFSHLPDLPEETCSGCQPCSGQFNIFPHHLGSPHPNDLLEETCCQARGRSQACSGQFDLFSRHSGFPDPNDLPEETCC
jgi:hypothetical protein